ncbi:MAG TPA: GspMb/PilO family protein, partial [Thermoanaerobaculia bacterium]|nr:GspMb/PilO family protein [Thermoanaerobaculia bacterium]
QRDVQQIYDERWATRAQRLTRMISEVKRLAISANLVPPSTSYSLSEPGGNRAARSGATEVGITFGVKGTYQQVRRLINNLELSEQFVIIDQISLSSAEGDQLNLNLQIKTLFRESPGASAAPANQQL